MDNDPSEVSKAAKLAFKDIRAEFHQIPPRSPSLNPIENIFISVRKMLEQEAIRLKIEHETFKDFKTRMMIRRSHDKKHAYVNRANNCFKRCKNQVLNVNLTSDVNKT